VFLSLKDRCDFTLRIIGNFEYELPGIDIEVIQWKKESEIKKIEASNKYYRIASNPTEIMAIKKVDSGN
jgi:hypothetical protein